MVRPCRLAVSLWLLSALNCDAQTSPQSLSNLEFGSKASPFTRDDSVMTKTGTTIVGVCCRDGVVLGADTRSTGGPLVIDKDKLKIHVLAPRLFCCAAGVSADCDQLTRACCQLLGLQRIENELSGSGSTGRNMLDSVHYAVSRIMDLLQTPIAGRMPESALILGGLDDLGPSLYYINEDGAQRTTFCALGSGSTDAIAVLESARRQWGRPKTISFRDGEGCMEQQVENVDVEEAIEAVRRAVQAGILNDLGSGSHVDLCVIKREEVRQWREELMRHNRGPSAPQLAKTLLRGRARVRLTESFPEGVSLDVKAIR